MSWAPVPNSPYGLCGLQQHERKNATQAYSGSCVKVEVDVLGSPSLIVPMVSVDVKQH